MLRALMTKVTAPTAPLIVQPITAASAWFHRWASVTAGRLAHGQAPVRCTGIGGRADADFGWAAKRKGFGGLLMSNRITSWLVWFWSSRSQPPIVPSMVRPGVFGTRLSTT